MTSAGMPSSRIASASRIESPVLPVAVGPARMTSGGAGLTPDEPSAACATQRVRPGVLHPDIDEPADERGVALEVDQTMLPGSAGHGRALPRWLGILVLVRPRWDHAVDQDFHIA